LSWLGLRDSAHGHLAVIQAAVLNVLPDHEAVVVRYVVVVSVLLTRVAYADGRFVRDELDHLRALLRRIERLPAEGIETVCQKLHELVPRLTEEEMTLCYTELRAITDAKERRQVMRLLAGLARVDGTIAPAEQRELEAIAGELGLAGDLAAVLAGPAA